MHRMNPKNFFLAVTAFIVVSLWALYAAAAVGPPVTPIPSGGLGTSTAPTYGKLLVGGSHGEYEFTSTTTLGLKTTNVAEGSNLYFTTGRAQAAISASYPLLYANGVVSAAYGTTTANSWSALQVFGNASTSALTVTGSAWLGTILSGTWNGSTIGPTFGGTGISNPTAAGVLVGSYPGGGWQQVATSSLGLVTTNVAEGSNLYWTNVRFDNRLSATTSLPSITTLASLVLPLSQTTGTLGVNQGGTASTSLGGVLAGNGTGAIKSATIGSGLSWDGTTLANTGVTSNAGDWAGTWQTFAPSHFQTALGFTPVPTTRNVATTYPLQGGGTLSGDLALTTAFSTTTANAFNKLNTFSNATSTLFSAGTIWDTGTPNAVLSTDQNGRVVGTSTIGVNLLSATTIGATSPNGTLTFGTAATLGNTFTGDLNLANPNAWTGLQTLGGGFVSTASSTVTGNLTDAGNLKIVGTANIVGTGNVVDVGNAGPLGINGTLSVDQLYASTTIPIGIHGISVNYATATPYSSINTGVIGDAEVGSSNTVDWTSNSALEGVNGVVGLSTGMTGTVNGAIALDSEALINSGTLTNLYDVQANDFQGGGTVTNLYGFYSTFLSRGTNNWAVYTSGSTPSYFGGNVGFATTTPAYLIDAYSTAPGTGAHIANGLIEVDPNNSHVASFGNYAMRASETTMGFAQEDIGNTYVNAAAGKVVGLRVNNSDVLSLNSSGFSLTGDITSLSGVINMRRNDPNNYISFLPQGGSGARDWWIGETRSGASLAPQGDFFVFDNTAGGTARLVIDPNGNAGIGTTTPGSLLSLNNIANLTTATSTFYSTGGINLAAGCFAISGNCLSLGSLSGIVPVANGGTNATSFTSGKLLSYNGTSFVSTTTIGNNQLANSSIVVTTAGPLGGAGTISLGGTLALTCSGCLTANQSITLSGDVTGSGATAITASLSMNNSHWWTAIQNFTNATTSGLEATSTNVFFDGFKNALLSTNAAGQVQATTSIGVNYLTGVLPIANGGTNATSQASGGLVYYDGTKITSGSPIQVNNSGKGLLIQGDTSWTSGVVGKISFGDAGSFVSATNGGNFSVTSNNAIDINETFSGNKITISPASGVAMTFVNGGNIGIATTTPAAKLDVNDSKIIVETAHTPASSSEACVAGTMEWDASFVYVCTSTNTFKRAALSTF